MAGPTNYYVCARCHKIGVYKSAMFDDWRCRYCGATANLKEALTEETYRCPECGELLERQARRAYDVLYRNPVLLPSNDLAAMIADTVAANAQYVQGMSPNSVFLASVQKLTGVRPQAMVEAVEHARQYHSGGMNKFHRKGQHYRAAAHMRSRQAPALVEAAN